MPVLTRRQAQIIRPSYDLSNGLVGWWTFDDGTGRDISGRQNHGSLINSPKLAGGRVMLATGQAYGIGLTASSSQKVTVANSTSINLTTGTIAAWAKLSSLSASTFYGIMSKFTAAGSFGYGMKIYTAASGSVVDFQAGQSYYFTIALNRWYHFAATFTSNSVIQYIDGIQVASGSTTVSSTTAALDIGNDYTGGRYWDGVIDDARVYNRVLSPGEINMLYSSAFQPQFVEPTYQLPPAVTHSAPNADVTVGGWTGG